MESDFILEPVTASDDIRHAGLRRLYQGWVAAQARAVGLPPMDYIDAETIVPVGDMLWCLDISTDPDSGGFVGRRFGAGTIAFYGMDPTGQPIAAFARHAVFGRILKVLRAVVGGQCPYRFVADDSVLSDGSLYHLEALGLPLGDDSGRLTGVLGATHIRRR